MDDGYTQFWTAEIAQARDQLEAAQRCFESSRTDAARMRLADAMLIVDAGLHRLAAGPSDAAPTLKIAPTAVDDLNVE